MTLEIKFTESEARIAHFYLKAHYNSKASFAKLAKQAIRDKVAERARVDLDEAKAKIEREDEP